MRFDCGQQRVMRLGWERPGSLALRRVPTNRMREYFTYGSVGGAGGNPGSYPAANPAGASRLPSLRPVRRVAELGSLDHFRSVEVFTAAFAARRRFGDSVFEVSRDSSRQGRQGNVCHGNGDARF